MITTEIKINGALIGYIYCVNVTPLDKHSIIQKYKVEYYKPDHNKLINFDVDHLPDDGAEALIEKCFKKIAELSCV